MWDIFRPSSWKQELQSEPVGSVERHWTSWESPTQTPNEPIQVTTNRLHDLADVNIIGRG
jgi:hypothetical protein